VAKWARAPESASFDAGFLVTSVLDASEERVPTAGEAGSLFRKIIDINKIVGKTFEVNLIAKNLSPIFSCGGLF